MSPAQNSIEEFSSARKLITFVVPPRRLRTYVKRYKAAFLFGVLALVAANLLKAVVPIAIQHSVDALAGPVTRSLLLRNSLNVIALGLLQSGFVFAQSWLLLGAAQSMERDMKNSFYEHLQKLSLEFFQANRTGELMARVNKDVAAVANGNIEALMYAVNTMVGLVIILPFMARLSGRLTLLAFAPLLLVLITTLAFQRRIQVGFTKVRDSYERMCVHAHEALCGVKTVRAYMQESAEVETFTNLSRHFANDEMATVRLFNLLSPLFQFFVGLSLIAVLWYGGDLTAAGTLSIGQFLEFILYLGYLAWPMRLLGREIAALQRGAVSTQRVESVFSVGPAIQDSSCTAAVPEIKGTLEFRNVTFKYQGMQKPAIEGVSFRINPGQIVGLVGLVGAGKSTLMNLVPRLLEPCSGDVFIDGRSVREFPLQVLRSSIGYVPQETFLFSDTVAANIAFGNGEAFREEIEQAAADSGIDSDIAAFPQGYETLVGERGVTLSGGQKQRISIARAVLSRPPILLLDDALSSVDSYTEEKIIARLRKRTQGKTCLISSQRISTLKRADLIIVVHEGRIVEQGTHEKLLARQGLYSKLYTTQLLEEELATG